MKYTKSIPKGHNPAKAIVSKKKMLATRKKLINSYKSRKQ